MFLMQFTKLFFHIFYTLSTINLKTCFKQSKSEVDFIDKNDKTGLFLPIPFLRRWQLSLLFPVFHIHKLFSRRL
jgi:hypothetical protein